MFKKSNKKKKENVKESEEKKHNVIITETNPYMKYIKGRRSISEFKISKRKSK